MAQRRKRLPGERNPEVDGTEVFLIQNSALASPGPSQRIEIARYAFAAWDRWQERRRMRKAIAAHRASEGAR